jgi:dethiobiotin synthetase
MMSKGIFITGIDTGVGKTLVSAMLAEALGWDYWKPVQAGNLEQSDSIRVSELLTNKQTVIHPETYRLKSAMSPHTAAKIDGVTISLNDFSMPSSSRGIIVEGAGGAMSPVSDGHVVGDLALHLGLPVIVVSANYLGSINHTLLTLHYLKSSGMKMTGIIFSGEEDEPIESYILKYAGVRMIGRLPLMENPDAGLIREAADRFDTSSILS